MNKQDLYDLMMGAAVIGLAFIAYRQSQIIRQFSTQAVPVIATAPATRQGIWAGDMGDITAGALGGSDGWRY